MERSRLSEGIALFLLLAAMTPKPASAQSVLDLLPRSIAEPLETLGLRAAARTSLTAASLVVAKGALPEFVERIQGRKNSGPIKDVLRKKMETDKLSTGSDIIVAALEIAPMI